LVTKGVTQWILTRAVINLIALLLQGFIFIEFSTAHSFSVSRSFCNFPMSFLFVIFIYILQSSAKNLILESISLQISLTYTINCSGPKTLSCGTPEVTLTSSDSYPLNLTLCIRPTTNYLTQTTNLDSSPMAASFVSSLS
jgi:hypothetical protein